LLPVKNIAATGPERPRCHSRKRTSTGIDNDRLFYSIHRGLRIYDLTDPKNPKQVRPLPVYGYPIEMFVAGNTRVTTLLSDALYLTEVNAKLQFDRPLCSSQLVAIDVTISRIPR